MGMAKQQQIEAQERGWSAPLDKYVCANCVDDARLKSVVLKAVVNATCSYCKQVGSDNIAAPIDVLIDVVFNTVSYLFNEPTEAGVPWDEGAFIVEPIHTYDVLRALPLDCHDELFEDVAKSFNDDCWVPAAGGHWASSHEHEILADSWNSFVSSVRHETRFHFHVAPLSPSAGPQEFAPGGVLPVLGDLINGSGLVRRLDANQLLYRIRIRAVGDAWNLNAVELGAPPLDRVRAGRMNPAGIPYLYVALDEATALAETVSSPPIEAVIATFRATRVLTVIDLTDLPPLPSVFDELQRGDREGLMFLRKFVEEISRPVTKDGSEHVDYVPSQVVSEYFAQVFQPSDGNSEPDGLLYPSAVRPGGKNLVLFPSDRGWQVTFDMVGFVSAETRQLNHWRDLAQSLNV